jgi:hypothetical protein
MNWNWLLKKVHNKYLWLCTVLLVITLFYIAQAPLTLKNTYLTDAAGKRTAINLPFLQDMPPGTEYVISGTIQYKRWLNGSVAHLIPDDHLLAIRVNRRKTALTGIPASALCDYTNGFHYNFSEYLHEGANHIEIRIKNTIGPSGLAFRTSYQDLRLLIGALIGMLLVCGLVYLLLLDTAFDQVFALILTGGFLIRVFYFLNTPFDVRTHDVGGHLQYIEYLVNNHMIPAIHYGWQTYQPPLYYLVTAFVYKLFNWAGITQTAQIWRGVQFLSLLLFMGFLGVTLGIVKNAIGKLPFSSDRDDSDSEPRTAVLASGDSRLPIGYLIFALIVFWPSGIIHSARIGNDVLFYLFYALGLAYLIKWRDDDTKRSLYRSFLSITLAFITKANALALYLIFGVVYLIKLGSAPSKREYLAPTLVLVVILLVGFGVTFGRMVEAKLQGSKDNFVVANASGLQGVTVGNGPRNYLSFDVQSFVTEPYVNPFEDKGGRQYFWNYLFKTGLVGEFGYNSPANRVLAIVLSIAFLMMLLYTGVSVIVFHSYFKGQLVLALNVIILLLSAIAFRISIPAACSNDFRYILPFLISFGGFFGFGIWGYRQQKWYWLEQVGYGLALVFIATSIGFFGVLSLSPVF